MKYFKESRVLRIENNRLKIIWNIEDDVEVSIYSLINNVDCGYPFSTSCTFFHSSFKLHIIFIFFSTNLLLS